MIALKSNYVIMFFQFYNEINDPLCIFTPVDIIAYKDYKGVCSQRELS
jgi:hypothetical protein